MVGQIVGRDGGRQGGGGGESRPAYRSYSACRIRHRHQKAQETLQKEDFYSLVGQMGDQPQENPAQVPI